MEDIVFEQITSIEGLKERAEINLCEIDGEVAIEIFNREKLTNNDIDGIYDIIKRWNLKMILSSDNGRDDKTVSMYLKARRNDEDD